MAFTFKHNRLHVGWRRRDWSDVWFEPITEAQVGESDESRREFFRNPRGTVEDEPDEAEITWLPPYDPKYCEAETKAKKKEMSLRNIMDLHTYMRERDPDVVRDYEETWKTQRLDFSRWNRPFKAAREFKKRQMAARRRREQRARARGIPEHIIAQADLDSDDDSTYDSDEEQAQTVEQQARSMPPPPTPNRGNGKRKPPTGGDPKPSHKKARTASRSTRSDFDLNGTPGLDEYQMSGGLGRGTPDSYGGNVSEGMAKRSYQAYVEDEDEDDNADDESIDFIDEHPEPPASPTSLHSRRSTPSASQPRGGPSARRSIPRFEEWIRARDYPSSPTVPSGERARSQTARPANTHRREGEGRRHSGPSNGGLFGRSLGGLGASESTNGRPGQSQLNGEPGPAANGNVDEGRRSRAAEFNGDGMDEDDAMRQAIRASMQPEEAALNRAISASLQPEDRNGRVDNVNHEGHGTTNVIHRSIEREPEGIAGSEGDIQAGRQVENGSLNELEDEGLDGVDDEAVGRIEE